MTAAWDMKKERKVTLRTPAGDVLHPRLEPCPDCPWRKDGLGKSPKEVFEVGKSRRTPNTFGCHMSGVGETGDAHLICAGYLAAEESNLNDVVKFARLLDSLPACSQFQCDAPMFDNYDDMARAHLAHKEEKGTNE